MEQQQQQERPSSPMEDDQAIDDFELDTMELTSEQLQEHISIPTKKKFGQKKVRNNYVKKNQELGFHHLPIDTKNRILQFYWFPLRDYLKELILLDSNVDSTKKSQAAITDFRSMFVAIADEQRKGKYSSTWNEYQLQWCTKQLFGYYRDDSERRIMQVFPNLDLSGRFYFYHKAATSSTGLESYPIENNGQLTFDEIYKFLRFKYTRGLNILGHPLTSQSLDHILRHFPYLWKFKFSYQHLPDLNVKLRHYRKPFPLRFLHVQHLPHQFEEKSIVAKMSQAAFLPLLHRMPNLEELYLEDTEFIVDQELYSHLGTKLKTFYCNSAFQGIIPLYQNKSKGIEHATLPTQQTKLQKFTLLSRTADLDTASLRVFLRLHPTLEELHLNPVTMPLEQNGVKEFLCNNRYLKHLEIPLSLVMDCLEELKSCSQMKVLHIKSDSTMDVLDSRILVIANAIQSLQSLLLQGFKFSHEVASLLITNNHLQNIGLVNCKITHSQFVLDIMKRSFYSNLHIENCTFETVAEIDSEKPSVEVVSRTIAMPSDIPFKGKFRYLQRAAIQVKNNAKQEGVVEAVLYNASELHTLFLYGDTKVLPVLKKFSHLPLKNIALTCNGENINWLIGTVADMFKESVEVLVIFGTFADAVTVKSNVLLPLNGKTVKVLVQEESMELMLQHFTWYSRLFS